MNKVEAASKAGNAPLVFQSYDIATLGLAHSGIITPIGDLTKMESILVAADGNKLKGNESRSDWRKDADKCRGYE